MIIKDGKAQHIGVTGLEYKKSLEMQSFQGITDVPPDWVVVGVTGLEPAAS